MTHVAITGASSGIGAALVAEFARAGASVTMVARRQAEMEAIAARVGGKTQIFAMDLCEVPRCCDWLAPAAARFGPIDVLINNAGVQIVEPTLHCEAKDIERMTALNLMAPMRLTLAVLPEMIQRGGGTIVDVSSLAALAGVPGMWGYNATKAGLAAASESLRGELKGTGVRVITVYPGPVDTPLARAAYDTYPNWVRLVLPEGTADELARRIRTAVELGGNRIIYPLPYHLPRLFPSITRWVLDNLAPHPQTKKSVSAPSEK
jgi:short-subunit dehydrogenase